MLGLAVLAAAQPPASVSLKFTKKRLKVTDAEREAFGKVLRMGRTGIVKLWNYPCGSAPVVDIDDVACLGQPDVAGMRRCRE